MKYIVAGIQSDYGWVSLPFQEKLLKTTGHHSSINPRLVDHPTKSTEITGDITYDSWDDPSTHPGSLHSLRDEEHSKGANESEEEDEELLGEEPVGMRKKKSTLGYNSITNKNGD